MTFVVEINRPMQARPWHFKSTAMRRIGWGPVAVTITSRSLDRLLNDARRGLTEWRGTPTEGGGA